MNYYELSIIGSPLELFTYQSEKNIEIGTKVLVEFHHREKSAVVISINLCRNLL